MAKRRRGFTSSASPPICCATIGVARAAASIEEIPEEFFAARGHAAQTDAQILLESAMRQMKPRERQMLWLAHAEGYSHREIAKVMGLNAASIRLLLFRARRKIAALLRACAADDGRKS